MGTDTLKEKRMSTANRTPHLLYRTITAKLSNVQRKELLMLFGAALLFSISLWICSFTIAALIELLFQTPTMLRTVLFFGSIALPLAFLLASAGKPLLQLLGVAAKQPLEQFALRVGKHFPEIGDRLSNALQLYTIGLSPKGVSGDLALAAFSTTVQQYLSFPFEKIIDRKKLRQNLLFFFTTLALALLPFLVIRDQYLESIHRLVHYNRSFLPPPPFTLTLFPQDTVVPRGADIQIRVYAKGVAPQKIQFHIKIPTQQEYSSYELQTDDLGTYTYRLTAVKQDVTFYASTYWHTEEIRTPIGRITVVEYPAIRMISGTITPPQYTKEPIQRIDESTTEIFPILGSEISLTAYANVPLKHAELRFLPAANPSDTIHIPMRIEKNVARTSWKIKESGQFFFHVLDTNNYANQDPVLYSINALPDAPPTITLLQPQDNVELDDRALVPVRVTITDDYGFTSLKFAYRLIYSDFAQPDPQYTKIDIPISLTQNVQEIAQLINFNDFGTTPGDQFECYLEVWDNDQISGPKSARTPSFFVQYPTLDEIFQEVEQTQEYAEQQMQQLLQQAEEIQRKAEEVQQEILKQQNRTVDWEQQKQIENLLQQQQHLAEQFQKIQRDLQQMINQMEQRNAISQETLEKYKELQQLMQEVNDPILQKRAEQLQKALQNVDPKKIQELLQNFKFDEEEFKKRLERTLNILKRLKAEQKTEEIAKRSQQLAEKQKELEQKLRDANPENEQLRQQLSEQQKKLQEELEQLKQEMKKLEELMKELGKDMPLDQLRKAMEELEQSEAAEQMQKAQQQIQQGQYTQAQQSQRRAQSALQQLMQNMQNLASQMRNQGTQEAIRTLKQSIQSLLELSKMQEMLEKQTAIQQYNSAGLQTLMQQQSQLVEALQNIVAALNELAQKSFAVTPEMGKSIADAYRQMQEAIQQLGNRNPQAAAQAQRKAMGSMNACLLQMQGALSMMQGSGQGQGQGEGQGPGNTGFMEQLQQMALEQQIINQGMQQLLRQMQGKRLTEDAQQRLGRLAAQQRALQQSLQELAEQQRKSPEGKRALGDLQKIAEEMKEIVSDMESGKITEETIRRQERILSRLLDATRSLRERDFEKRREARTAEEITKESPPELSPELLEGKTSTYELLLQSLRKGYSRDYERLIQQYFEALQRTQQIPR